ncbi:PIN domain-containing protein [Streptomyces sp. TRM75563]|uniref:PIN domain-containing protein n=1 Tax=Streptomyces sp. TRM75563 TaxID=2817418 RepID=UPI001F60E97F|nr:PIN domain-containing protein [Streptomyces sp. TRM75563]MCI4045611.1 PIN domain-containing protein [Streptomyces sp. TRM75563]
MWRRPLSDYEEGVKTYLITLDTNVLLNLYRFTPPAREELLSVLKSLQDRLWVSHQVGLEYYSRRMTAVNEHITLYTSVPKSLNEARNKAVQELNTFAKRRSMSPEDRDKLVEPIEKSFDSVIGEIASHAKSFDLSLTRVATSDPVLEALAEILDNKTGAPFTEEDSKTHVEKFTKRAESQVPPGYKDANKSDNAHGDYFFWEQVLREAETRGTPVLLVTNDAKEDWVRQEAGITIGPRPELVREFKDRCGQDFLLTDLGTFLKVAKSELGAAISESTVAQAENIEENTPTRKALHISLQEHDRVIEELMLARESFKRTNVAEFPPAERRRIAAFRRETETALEIAHAFTPVTRPDGSLYVQVDPESWSYILYVRDQSHSIRPSLKRRSEGERIPALQKKSHNLQERLQRLLLERREMEEELQNLEELISLGSDGDSDELQQEMMDIRENLITKIKLLQNTEDDLTKTLHYVQLQLRSN